MIALTFLGGTGVALAEPARNPLAGVRLFVDPDAVAVREAARLRAVDPAQAALVDRIATTPTAVWLGDWTTDLSRSIDRVFAGAAAQGTTPSFVLYAIPHRDCDGHSAGGARNAAAYRSWISEVVAAIRGRRAVVVVEPDALAQLDCLDAAMGAERVALLRSAVTALAKLNAVTTYVDAGNARWHPADVMADRLRQVGVRSVRGFSLNVANFVFTTESERYGEDVVRHLGSGHYVVDTSRNGRGPSDTVCNPVGVGLGSTPTARAKGAHADAYLWVKHPGVSDGPCNGGPVAGSWWLAGALALARNAKV